MTDPIRTQACSLAQANARLKQAETLLASAELIGIADDDYRHAVGPLCVHAGIAAADATCGFVLGKRARGSNHRDAIGLLRQIGAKSAPAVSSLTTILEMKDDAEYMDSRFCLFPMVRS